MMFIKHITTVLTVVTLALGSPLERRSTGETVIADLSAVSTDFSEIKLAMQLFNGSIASAARVPVAVTSLKGHLKATLNDTHNSGVFSPSESMTITKAWSGLTSSYSESLHDAVAKKAQFVKLNMGDAMVDNFHVVTDYTDAISRQLKKKVAVLDTPTIDMATAQMDGALNAAVQAYTT
ncbi:hydrophobic surface binding protein A [Paecilomyces variotii No. 5]|uniref:Hydrophobic surface binding protein A n=1 Tax=Byssochlamys spectabilis (strain No. 5 / NBRC 109023) TaxID=1356009 RepID=V5FBE1_BYSSN|nr:hydrophobic surface binding protein A [Paecilomyces variotii No. 5]